MPAPRDATAALLRRLTGRKVSAVAMEDEKEIRLQFEDGAMLTVSTAPGGLAVQVTVEPDRQEDSGPKPTERQREYLAFIAKYMQHFGAAPAEADIQRHFLVSAPTVHQMMLTLEKRGFIKRQPGVARSIRLCIDIPPA